MILPGEDPAEFDEPRATLRTEHQPANATEEILVDELARKRTGREPVPSIKRRMSPRFVSETKTERGDSADLGAGRESVVRDQDKARDFVPQKPVEEQKTSAAEPTPAGFVPQKTAAELKAFEYFGYFPEDHDEYVESIVNARLHPPHNAA